MRVRRDNNHTYFSTSDRAGSQLIAMRRVFHPTRGEEVQLDIELTKKTGTRSSTARASLTMTPTEADEFTRTMRGNKTPPKVIGIVGPIRSEAVNEYRPHNYATLSERERQLVREAFEAGRQYSESLK